MHWNQTMNAKQYRKALDKLGWSQLEAARQLGFDPRTSRRYALGERKVPKTVELLLKIKVQQEKEAKATLLQEMTGREAERLLDDEL
jgi:transcriptional regulator with XRE-family HTH domain